MPVMQFSANQKESSVLSQASAVIYTFRMRIVEFIEGAQIPADGLRHLRENRLLATYAAFPIAVNSILTLGLLTFFTWTAMRFGGRVGFEPGWLGTTLKILFYTALTLATLGLTAGSSLLSSMLVLNYFQSSLTEKVERDLGVREGELSAVSLWVEAGDSARNFFSWLTIQVALLLLNWIPVLGTLGAGIGSWYFGAFFLGAECLDFPLALRGYRRDAKMAFARKHLGATLGLGTVLLAVSWIPVVGAFAMTASVAGSSLWFRKVRNRD